MIRWTEIQGRRKKERHYYFDSRFFDFEGKTYEIVGTEITGPGPFDVVHKIKGATQVKEVKMRDLVDKLLRPEKKDVRKPYKD